MGKILLVEDDNNLREIYGARLMAEGHEIVSASDGEEALAIAVKEKPDLIIADVMMPRISGFDMLDILRNAPETKNTKIIMMTALSQQEDKEHAEKLGADKYLVKSQVTLEDVAQVVREILGGPKGGQDKPDDTPSQTGAPQDTPPSTPPPSLDKPANPPAAEQKPTKTPISSSPAPTMSAPPTAPATPVAPQQTAAPEDKPPAQEAQRPPDTAKDPSSNSALSSAATPSDPSALSSPPSGNNPAKSSSISIPVVEPPADKLEDKAKQAENTGPKPESTPPEDPQQTPTSQGAPSSDSGTTSLADSNTNDTTDATDDKKDEGDEIGPNLAQALAEEEKQVKEQIDNFENKIDDNTAKKDGTGGSNQPTVISPTQPKADDQAPAEPPENPSSGTPAGEKDDAPTNSSVSPTEKDSLNPKKKIIQPINDLSKKPDLEAMAAEEEKTAKVINQNVIAPKNQPSDTDNKPDNKTNPHDISI